MQDLRDDVPCPLDKHLVADPDVMSNFFSSLIRPAVTGDIILIVKRRIRHHDAPNRYRCQAGDGCERARSTDLNIDRFDCGFGFFGREFVRDRPTRRARLHT